MGWVLSSFIYQVKFWYFVDDLNEQLIEAEQISALDSCSDPLVSSALSIVSRDFVHPSNDNLTIVIIIAPICILLWVLLWHSNANFVLEQRDLVDQHFPPGGAAGGGGGAPLPALPEPEPPKPKSAAVVENAQLVELRNKIGNLQGIKDQNPIIVDDLEESKQQSNGPD